MLDLHQRLEILTRVVELQQKLLIEIMQRPTPWMYAQRAQIHALLKEIRFD